MLQPVGAEQSLILKQMSTTDYIMTVPALTRKKV
jgi:hypothetical protein